MHQNKGDQAYRQDDYDEAENEYKAAIREGEKLNPNSATFVICLRSLAQVYIAQKKYDEAEKIYQRRISIASNYLTDDPVYLATVYDDLATFYILQNRFNEAMPLEEKTISLLKVSLGEEDSRVAEKLEYYATLLEAKGRNEEAAQLEYRAGLIRHKSVY